MNEPLPPSSPPALAQAVFLPRFATTPQSPAEALAGWAPEDEREMISLDGGKQLAVAVRHEAEVVRVRLVSNAGAGLLLHWGLAWHYRDEWRLPSEGERPAGSTQFGEQAARTPFADRDGLQYLELTFRKPDQGQGPRALRFVLFLPSNNAWIKSTGREASLPLFEPEVDPRLGSAALRDLTEQIVGPEKGSGSWTLMHRSNLCHDLLGAAQGTPGALPLFYVWLRYSALRQLDWQRRYNTKPRELAHAQDRLTVRLASLWRASQLAQDPVAETGVNGRLWARLMLTTLGRGGDGQRVRDEILHIMHRNGLKETAGNFMEEWHQKLHNNTTPDDVVICEAYLAFLRSDGKREEFYRVLEEGGVTRERLLGFERPIRTDPNFDRGQKDALIGEFSNFLRILHSVHSGTDLETAINAARHGVHGDLRGRLDHLLGLRGGKAGLEQLIPAITAAREGVAQALGGANDGNLRDLLFLDLALEGFLRGQIERQNLSQLDPDHLAELVGWAIRNLALSVASPEVGMVAGHWSALLGRPATERWAGKDWALEARSVADRAGRWVAQFSSDLYAQLQPKADCLGEAFGASPWTVALFAEEVIRGGPAFALAMLLRHLDPVLRRSAGLGGWQVISPARAAGKVRLAGKLLDVQGQRFPEPTVLVADTVAGTEEIPENVKAVITSDSPDLVSHLAVRARNAGVLFATCYDASTYESLKGLADRGLVLQVTPGGDVEFREGEWAEPGAQARPGASAAHTTAPAAPPAEVPWVLTQDQFAAGIVGGKSNNLNGLRGRLPEWIRLPSSLALPFGTFEKVLATAENASVRQEYERLVAAAGENPGPTLDAVRQLVPRVVAPGELKAALLEAWQRVGLANVPWEQAWSAVTRVWASKWNERAFLSRRARGVPHDALRMAVLVQQVVEADYAFVIHTVNPLTGNRDEVFAEVVLGLGETLVGNYPGRALGFTFNKSSGQIELISYPGKSVGLYGRGVIFRSDSNGEDLEDFAGAGLYDSFLAQDPEHRLLDYRTEKLVNDRTFRAGLLQAIGKIGVEVERALGSPQDVEGAVSGGQFFVVQTRPQVGLSA